MERHPIWLMRQAGRYLAGISRAPGDEGRFPRAVLRSRLAAAEVTLQPLRRFGFDGAILFSDILVIPARDGTGVAVSRRARGRGSRRRCSTAISESLASDPQATNLRRSTRPFEPGHHRSCRSRCDDARLRRLALDSRDLHGRRRRQQGSGRGAAARLSAIPIGFQRLIDAIATATVDYLCGQIDAGVEAVQLFDSWAGSLAPDEFRRWVVAPTRAIVEALRSRRPGRTESSAFPKGIGEKLPSLRALETRVDAIGIDETIDPAWANDALPIGLPVQGNLDPLVLLAGGGGLDAAPLKTHPGGFRSAPACVQSRPWHPSRHAGRACRAPARAGEVVRDEPL